MLSRPAEFFAVAAIGLLVFALLSRFLVPSEVLGVSLGLRRTGYIFSVASVSVFMAAVLCVFAAIYSFWILPMNQRAAMWHFWLTASGIAIYWVGLYLFFKYRPHGELHGRALAATVGWLTAFPLLVIAQGIFLVNLISGLMNLRRAR